MRRGPEALSLNLLISRPQLGGTDLCFIMVSHKTVRMSSFKP